MLQPSRWTTRFLVAKRDNKTITEHTEWESRMHNDLIMGDFNENYYNQSYKMEMAIEWASLYCSYDYMLKTDADVFINMNKLFDLVDHPDVPKGDLYTGYVNYHSPVLREGKWAVSREVRYSFMVKKFNYVPRYIECIYREIKVTLN